jgi:hypothetical protein
MYVAEVPTEGCIGMNVVGGSKAIDRGIGIIGGCEALGIELWLLADVGKE